MYLNKVQYTEKQIQKILDLINLLELKGVKNWTIMNNIIAILDKGEIVNSDVINNALQLIEQEEGKDDLGNVKNEVK